MRARGRTTALAACLILLGAVVAPTAGAEGAAGAAAAASPAAAGTTTASAAAKRCRIVRVKKRTKSGKVVKRGGKPVYVRKRKCKPKAKAKPKETTPPPPQPSPTPPVIPNPPPAPPAPRIEIVGWSTQDVPGATPPADLVQNGGTITSCVEDDRVSVWVRQFSFTTAGPITTTWTRSGTSGPLTSGAAPSTIEGANRYFLIDNTPPLLNATYQVSWSYSGGPIASASVTLSCPP
jgi:hypothetical protein